MLLKIQHHLYPSRAKQGGANCFASITSGRKKTPQKTTIAKNQNTMKRIPLPTVAAATTTTNANKNSKTKKRRTTRNCIKCVPIVNPDQKHPKDMAH